MYRGSLFQVGRCPDVNADKVTEIFALIFLTLRLCLGRKLEGFSYRQDLVKAGLFDFLFNLSTYKK